jgi:hypothetical protein
MKWRWKSILLRFVNFDNAVGTVVNVVFLNIRNQKFDEKFNGNTLSGIDDIGLLSSCSWFKLPWLENIFGRVWILLLTIFIMYFTDNLLQTVSDNAFQDLKSLNLLFLDNTRLTTIPKAVINLPSLFQLTLSNTRIDCTCENLGWIKDWTRRSVWKNI